MYGVPIASPNMPQHRSHTSDGVPRFPQVQQVVGGKVPLPVPPSGEDGNCAVSQGSQHTPSHVPEEQVNKCQPS